MNGNSFLILAKVDGYEDVVRVLVQKGGNEDFRVQTGQQLSIEPWKKKTWYFFSHLFRKEPT